MNVAVRELWRGRVWRIAALRLVEERDGVSVLWAPAGAPVLRPFADGRQLRIPGETDWRLELRPSAVETVVLARAGARHTLWLEFADGRFRDWYVNLERGSHWRARCFDIVDEKLDLVVAAEGQVRWKDEDELAAAAASGYLDEQEVRAEAERLLAEPSWPTGYESFVADPAWPMPALPAAWHVAPLETQRLRLVPLSSSALAAYSELLDDAQGEIDVAERHWLAHDFGPWALHDRADDAFVGVVEVHFAHAGVEGLGTDEIEVGWTIVPARRGHGLATEAARAAIADVLTRTGGDHVAAYVRPENVASLAVVRKLGFRLRGPGRARSGDPVDIYVLAAAARLPLRAATR